MSEYKSGQDKEPPRNESGIEKSAEVPLYETWQDAMRAVIDTQKTPDSKKLCEGVLSFFKDSSRDDLKKVVDDLSRELELELLMCQLKGIDSNPEMKTKASVHDTLKAVLLNSKEGA